MAWRAFNYLMDKPRPLILDTRCVASYSRGHIRGSICVKVSHDGKTLVRLAGPGPPTWSQNCWWDRHVLLVPSTDQLRNRKRKAAELEERNGERQKILKSGVPSDPVWQFMQKEGLVRSVWVLGNDEIDDKDDGDDDVFSSFARSYPFLITKSTKASKLQNYPTEIVPRLLYLGDREHAQDEDNLRDLQISHVLTIHTEPFPLSKLFVYVFCYLADDSTADIAQYFDLMFNFVSKAKMAGARALVHCGAGASRSATLCAAYLMRIKHWSVEDTLKFLKEQRSQVNPNSGFVFALHNYHEVLKAITIPHQSGQFDLPKLGAGSKEESNEVEHDSFQLQLDVVKCGSAAGTVTVSKKTTYFGRSPDCDVILDHASISRQHAMFEKEKKGVVKLVDMGSSHGTFVNGKLLPRGSGTILQPGDVVQFGASTRSYIVRSTIM